MSLLVERLVYATDLTDLTNKVSGGSILTLDNQVAYITSTFTFHRLNSGSDGTSTSHWTLVQTEASKFTEYNSLNSYFVGDALKVGTTFYICILDSSPTETPTSNPNKYSVVATQTMLEAKKSLETIVTIDSTDSPYTVPSWDYLIQADTTLGDIEIVLPSAMGNSAKKITTIKTSSANSLIAVASGLETINGSPRDTKTTQWSFSNYTSNGTNIIIL
tara:strand:- start:1123 stop:1776 length:654 start_codon:yes stop_codon:yes gene_type:complete